MQVIKRVAVARAKARRGDARRLKLAELLQRERLQKIALRRDKPAIGRRVERHQKSERTLVISQIIIRPGHLQQQARVVGGGMANQLVFAKRVVKPLLLKPDAPQGAVNLVAQIVGQVLSLRQHLKALEHLVELIGGERVDDQRV